MDTQPSFLVSLFILCCCKMQHASAYTPTDAEALQSALLASYSKDFRPSATTKINLDFGLMHITELDIVVQRLHCVGFLRVSWIDDRLQWIPASYANMTALIMLASKVWTPPLILNNAADEIKVLNDNSDLNSIRVFTLYTGFVVWLAPVSFLAQCTINIQYYPFDSQDCTILVSSWLYVDTQLAVRSASSSLNLDIYEEHGEWEITKSSVANVTRILNGFTLPAVQFTLRLTRKYSYYLMNMLLPVIILAAMAPFVFLLPVESGEKIGFALTILLSLSVVMTIVSENIPPTSSNICVLSVYLLLTFILCSLQTLVTVITCRLHELHNRQYEMGSGLQKITGCLAKVTRYRRRLNQEDKRVARENKVANITDVETTDKEHLQEKKIGNKLAWGVNQETIRHTEEEVETEYTYEDLVCLYENFNFILFTTITWLETLTFMILLETGDGQ